MNPEKSLSEFGIRGGKKVKVEKERRLVIRELSASGNGGHAQNDVY
jgi:hypothetical protein